MIYLNIDDDLRSKWERAQQSMAALDADGCLLADEMNIYYMAGCIYSGYFYLPVEGEPQMFVKRPKGLTDERVEYVYKPEQMAEIFEWKGIKRPEKLLLEADQLTYSDYQRLLAVFQPKATGNATTLMRSLRQIKTPWEIEQFRLSAKQHAQTYREIPSCYGKGMSDLDFQFEIEQRMRRNGSIGIFRTFGSNMDIFMGSVLAGDNAMTPSPFDFALGGGGVASLPIGANGTMLTDGMSIMVDMAGNYTPYITDMTRVFSVGALPGLAYKAHEVSMRIQEEVMAMAKPGTPCADIYNLAMQITLKERLSDYFMGYFQQAKFVGHGIGLQINELPVLSPRSKEVLEPNMVFALEPKYVIPHVGAVGIENSFLVTETGLEKLTIAPEEIIRL